MREPSINIAPEDGRAAEVLAAQAGDRAAFGRLYEKYSRMVHGILLAHVPYQEADDLMQNVFAKALQKISGLRETEAVGGWFATLARNAAVDFYRRSRPNVELLERHSTTRNVRVEAFTILAEIQKLPEAYRETLVLRLVEGMTGPEIAERTGLTPDSVRVNLSRGMKQLRERLSI